MHNLCDNCGLCCMHMGSPPFVPGEYISKNLENEIEAFLDSPRNLHDSKPCLWLDLQTGKCKHYGHRPDVCREFEVGGEACERFRKGE